ncbi:restriction endonuclease [Candidatus Methylomirabilis sp.]|uniref:restriction endonuclease n=1 Tax=Candidatus Methylomirabilis sp. TaxID=2032687 RepID=UPI003C7321E1
MPSTSTDGEWLEYERAVLSLFKSTGYRCEHDVTLQGARGRHQVDVVVHVETIIGFHPWLVECKNWGRPVGKREVAAFRTIVEDVGADHGYLVSKAGFQDGALQLARTLNISLTNLAELTTRFTEEQLLPDHKQSREFWCSIETADDLGNMDSEAIVELHSRAGLSVPDHLIELHVIRKGVYHAVLPADICNKFITPKGTLRVSVPWDILHFCGAEPELIPLDGGGVHATGKTTSGEWISGPYQLVFRTLAGPVNAGAYVTDYK